VSYIAIVNAVALAGLGFNLCLLAYQTLLIRRWHILNVLLRGICIKAMLQRHGLPVERVLPPEDMPRIKVTRTWRRV
jgi:hypothetical protein